VSFEPPMPGRESFLRFVPTKTAGCVLTTTPHKTTPPYEALLYDGVEYRLCRYGRKWNAWPYQFRFVPQERPSLVVKADRIRNLYRRIRELPGRHVPK
jgi:hypothetical protein